MEGNVRGHTTPKDLGARAQLLVEKHAAYITKVADVSYACCKRTIVWHIICMAREELLQIGTLRYSDAMYAGQRHPGSTCH